jgi:trimeric autotransporter adhesin
MAINRNFQIKNGISVGNGGTILVSSGNSIGIGTTNPTSTLQVSGAVSATSFVGSGESLTNIPASSITNSSITIATSTGLSGGGSTSLGGTLTLSNTGVLSLATSGVGLSVNNSTGSVTVSSNATSSNTANTIVARDASGNFSAGTITANLSGNASTATTATNVSGGSVSATTGTFSSIVSASSFSGSLNSSNLTGTIPSSVLGNSTVYVGTSAVALNRSSANQSLSGISSISLPGASSGTITIQAPATAGTNTITFPANTGTVALTSDITTPNNGTLNLNVSGVGLSGTAIFTANQSSTSTFTVTSNATDSNAASTIVARDSSGNFSAGTITAVLNGNANTATTASNVFGTGGRVLYNSSTNTTSTSANLTFDGTNLGVSGTVTCTSFVGNGVIPVGGIIMWSGSIASIPNGWSLCNGQNGTPDLRDRFVVGAGNAYSVANTGGSKDAIVVSHNHTINDPGHSHTTGIYLTNNVGQGGSSFAGSYFGSNTGSGTGVSPTGISVNTAGQSGTNANLPPYYALAFIMRIS